MILSIDDITIIQRGKAAGGTKKINNITKIEGAKAPYLIQLKGRFAAGTKL